MRNNFQAYLMMIFLMSLTLFQAQAQRINCDFEYQVSEHATLDPYSLDCDDRLIVWNSRAEHGNDQILAFELTSNVIHEISTPNGLSHGSVNVSRGVIAWQETTLNSDPPASIYVHDFDGVLPDWNVGETREVYRNEDGTIDTVDIQGEWIVWIEDNVFGTLGDVYAMNLVSGERKTISTSPDTEWSVRFGGNDDCTVMWTSAPGYIWDMGWEARVYDLCTDELIPLLGLAEGDYQAWEMSGDLVLLGESQGHLEPYELMVYNVSAQREECRLGSGAFPGRIRGDLVVYNSNNEHGGPIKGFDLNSRTFFDVSCEDAVPYGYGLGLSASLQVAWLDQRSGSTQIYGNIMHPDHCLTLTVDNLLAGRVAEWVVEGASAEAKVAIVYGFAPGTTGVYNYGGYCATFDIEDVGVNRVIGQPLANASGVATVTKRIPAGVRGVRVLMQAAEKDTCPDECVSNLLDEIIR